MQKRFTIKGRWTVLHMLSYLLCFWVIISLMKNSEKTLWMLSYQYSFHLHRRGKKLYSIQRMKQKERHQIWGKAWKLPKKQTKNNLSSSNGLAETCEEPTLIIYHMALSFSKATCVICVAQMVKEMSFLAMHYFIIHGMQPWKK